MNVTVSIGKELLRLARHKAVDDGLSLSAWIKKLLERELKKTEKEESLLDALGDARIQEFELDFPRSTSSARAEKFQQ